MNDTSPQVRSNDLDELELGEFFVQNNMWGKGTLTGYEQCISKEGEHGFPVRWHWTWPEQCDAFSEPSFGGDAECRADRVDRPASIEAELSPGRESRGPTFYQGF